MPTRRTFLAGSAAAAARPTTADYAKDADVVVNAYPKGSQLHEHFGWARAV